MSSFGSKPVRCSHLPHPREDGDDPSAKCEQDPTARLRRDSREKGFPPEALETEPLHCSQDIDGVSLLGVLCDGLGPELVHDGRVVYQGQEVAEHEDANHVQ